MGLCAVSEIICGFGGPSTGGVGFEGMPESITLDRLGVYVGIRERPWPIAGFDSLPPLETVTLTGAVFVLPTLAVTLLVPGPRAVIVVTWPVWVTETTEG